MNVVSLIGQKREKKKQEKYNVVYNEWLKFYETREKHLGKIELPAFILANHQMKIIMATGELNFYYKKIMNYKKKKAIA